MGFTIGAAGVGRGDEFTSALEFRFSRGFGCGFMNLVVVGRWRWRREGALSWMAVGGVAVAVCVVVREVRFGAVN